MKRLLENKDFQEFIEIGKAQLAGHLLHVRTPLQKQSDVYLQEFRKGAAFGIDTLLATPGNIVTTADSILKKDEEDAARRDSIDNPRKPDPNADTESERGVVTSDSNLEPDNY